MITTDGFPPKTVRVLIEVDIKVFPYADVEAIAIAKQIVAEQLGLEDARITSSWIIEP